MNKLPQPKCIQCGRDITSKHSDRYFNLYIHPHCKESGIRSKAKQLGKRVRRYRGKVV